MCMSVFKPAVIICAQLIPNHPFIAEPDVGVQNVLMRLQSLSDQLHPSVPACPGGLGLGCAAINQLQLVECWRAGSSLCSA